MTAPHYSASQVATFRDCQRKWAFDKIDGLPRKTNAYAEFGSAIHTVLEKYLVSGELPDDKAHICTVTNPRGDTVQYFGKHVKAIILPGIQYLPPPGQDNVTTEERFTLKLETGENIVGFIDVTEVHADTVTVYDHKTTTDFKWAKTPEELAKDPQTVIYAVQQMRKHSVNTVTGKWVYYLRHHNRPKAKAVEVTLTADGVQEPWEAIIADIKEMAALHKSGKRAADLPLPPDMQACNKYGGCPYKESCGLSGGERIRGVFMQHKSMRERLLAAKKAAAEQPPAPEAEVAPPAPVNPPPAVKPKAKPPTIVKKKAPPAPPVAADPKEDFEDKPKPAPAPAPKPAPVGDVAFQAPAEIAVLYVNCRPVNESVKSFSELLHAVQEQIQADHGVSHYRLVPDLFGGNAALFQQYLIQCGLPSELYIDTSTAEAKDALAMLESKAARIIRAM